MARLLSVDVGPPREIAWRGKIVYTSVWKEPVAGGAFATVLRAPQSAAEYPSAKVAVVFSKFDKQILEFMAGAVLDGKPVIPISLNLPLREAVEAQAAAEKRGVRYNLLVA